MAICNALTGVVAKSCSTNTGGVRKMWLSDWDELTFTLAGDGTINTINAGPNNVVTTTANVNTQVSGFVRAIQSVTITGGDYSAIFTPGKQFKFTYVANNVPGPGTTIQVWTGQVLSSGYVAGLNVTNIVPDFSGFTPLVGTAAQPAPPNTGNSTVSTYIFFEYEFNRNTSSFTENLVSNLENGTQVYNQSVMLKLSRRDKFKRDAIAKLVAGQKKLLAVILDSNGLYWLMGVTDGLYATEITGGSGVAKADENGYMITLTAEESLQARVVDPNALPPYLINAQ